MFQVMVSLHSISVRLIRFCNHTFLAYSLGVGVMLESAMLDAMPSWK